MGRTPDRGDCQRQKIDLRTRVARSVIPAAAELMVCLASRSTATATATAPAGGADAGTEQQLYPGAHALADGRHRRSGRRRVPPRRSARRTVGGELLRGQEPGPPGVDQPLRADLHARIQRRGPPRCRGQGAVRGADRRDTDHRLALAVGPGPLHPATPPPTARESSPTVLATLPNETHGAHFVCETGAIPPSRHPVARPTQTRTRRAERLTWVRGGVRRGGDRCETVCGRRQRSRPAGAERARRRRDRPTAA